MHKAIFLDRDGVINVDYGYVYRKEEFEFIPGVFEALRHFQNLGYKLIIVTNQSGIGRGYYTKEDFWKLMEWVQERFLQEGIRIDDIFYCPHHPDQKCRCRKPEPAMLQEAIRKHSIDAKRSWMIGDKPSDIEAAKRAGVENTILLGKDAKDIFDTIKIIKG